MGQFVFRPMFRVLLKSSSIVACFQSLFTNGRDWVMLAYSRDWIMFAFSRTGSYFAYSCDWNMMNA